METHNITAGAFSRLRRKEAEYRERYERWEQERLEYIAAHGLAAWNAKVEREIKDLYPESV